MMGTDLCRYAQKAIIGEPAVTGSLECKTLSY